LGFPQATKYFNSKKVLVSGNPLRKEIYQKNFPQINDFKHLLILGGSQGALAVNQVILDLLPLLNEKFPYLSIVHQTGEKDLEKVKTTYEKNFKGDFQVLPFIQNVFEQYEKADLVVSRSGALTVSEIIESQRPAIFVPYPRLGQNDQTANAYWLESLGCAGVVEQGDQFKERFWKTLLEKSSKEKLKEMSKNLGTLKQKPSSDLIVRDISEAIECTKR
jgi:UDP-N-acetylglucosamine--N-acetylmuramyl-(pentapeptide) pyrophosphoryl-undecaprenol N-acetylglucosamine transferase